MNEDSKRLHKPQYVQQVSLKKKMICITYHQSLLKHKCHSEMIPFNVCEKKYIPHETYCREIHVTVNVEELVKCVYLNEADWVREHFENVGGGTAQWCIRHFGLR